jgi:hypothetical protein
MKVTYMHLFLYCVGEKDSIGMVMYMFILSISD